MSGPGMRSRKSSSNWGAHSPVGSICANPGTASRAVSKSSLAFRIAHTSRSFTLSQGFGDDLREPHFHEQNHDTSQRTGAGPGFPVPAPDPVWGQTAGGILPRG